MVKVLVQLSVTELVLHRSSSFIDLWGINNSVLLCPQILKTLTERYLCWYWLKNALEPIVHSCRIMAAGIIPHLVLDEALKQLTPRLIFELHIICYLSINICLWLSVSVHWCDAWHSWLVSLIPQLSNTDTVGVLGHQTLMLWAGGQTDLATNCISVWWPRNKPQFTNCYFNSRTHHLKWTD